MQPETGQVNGGLGLILLGGEEGRWSPQFAGESGLIIPGDANFISTLDLNNDFRPDLVVAKNNGAMQAFLCNEKGQSSFVCSGQRQAWEYEGSRWATAGY
jgi:hypothetical protein